MCVFITREINSNLNRGTGDFKFSPIVVGTNLDDSLTISMSYIQHLGRFSGWVVLMISIVTDFNTVHRDQVPRFCALSMIS